VPNPTKRWIYWRLEEELMALKPSLAISGMAQGVDLWAAHICTNIGIPFVAAIPFEGQEKMWPVSAQFAWKATLQLASEIVVVCPGGYSPQKMQRRNEYMVDRADVLLAVWDGTSGGTGNCVRYAEKKGKRIVRITP
jgi:uncharacterized phage-like protein YoqJ